MKKRYLWGFTGLLLCGIVGLAEAHDGYRKHSPNRLLIPPQTYVDNCGSCHTAYSALLLPSGSWKRLMGDLPNHFDAAVELDAADKEQIGAWLQGNGNHPARKQNCQKTSWRHARQNHGKPLVHTQA